MKLVHVPETTDVKFPPSEYRFNAPGTEIVGYTITVPHKEDITPISILEKTYKEGLYPNYETILNEIVPIKWEDNTIQIHIAEIDSCYRNIFLQWIPGRDEWIGIEEASWRPSEKYGLDSKYQGPFKLDEKYASKIITAFWLNHDDFFKSFKVSDAIKKSPETLEGMMTFENRTSRFLYLAEKGPTYYFDGLHESGLGDLEVSVCSDDVDKLHDECKSLVEIAKTVVKENSSEISKRYFKDFVGSLEKLSRKEYKWQVHLEAEIEREESHIPSDDGHYTDHITGTGQFAFWYLGAALGVLNGVIK